MRKFVLSCTLLCAVVLLISATPVHAQNVGFVAPNGNDANTCSLTAPCTSFQGVINKGGFSHIYCLTSGAYGAVTITTSITIDCGTGNVGLITLLNTPTAITINTAAPATIILRHLNINTRTPMASGHGILATSFHSGTLVVDDCTIQGFSQGYGIYFAPTSGRGTLQVSNSQALGNIHGIIVKPSATQIASVTLNQVELNGNSATGIFLTGPGIIAGTVRHSVAASNGSYGVLSDASQVYFTIEELSVIANLSAGINTSSAGSFLKVGASTIGGNGTGVKAILGSIVSFGNNQISDNGANGNFTSTTPLR